MSISLKLTQSINEITKLVNNAIYEEINLSIKKNLNKTKNKFITQIKNWIEEQPEIKSLNSAATQNSLAALFGLTPSDSDQAVRQIINSVINSLQVDIKFNNKLTGDVIFNIQPEDFSNILALPEGHRLTDKNIDLHWLDWLLTKGSTVIIIGYYYKPSSRGRSAAGHMSKGGSFRVPPTFAGNLDNNFITRSFQGREQEISAILQGLLA